MSITSSLVKIGLHTENKLSKNCVNGSMYSTIENFEFILHPKAGFNSQLVKTRNLYLKVFFVFLS